MEQSKDGNNFEVIGIVKGAGNSTTTKNYSFTDEHPLAGKNYYRLKQTDYDGNFTYSKIISINNQQTNKLSINIYPVPAGNILKYEFSIEQNAVMNVSVIDVLGNVVIKQETKAVKGINNFKLNINQLSQGIYFLKVNNEKELTQIKFIKN